MKKKLLGIFVCMLLIATALPAVGTMTEKEINNKLENVCSVENSNPPQPLFWPPVDQKQTSNGGYGFIMQPPFYHAQGFKPTKNRLTAVQLLLFKHASPPAGVEITVSIRDSLNGSDLTAKTVSADKITKKSMWVLFNFPDINVTPEDTYYIVTRADGGVENDTYCWVFDFNNTYTRGIAYESNDSGLTWIDMEDLFQDPNYMYIDFCFKTHFTKSRNKAFNINLVFLNFLQNHPHMFPILRHLLRL